ncbi:uncharacterized protein LOC125671864 [Ostrea edulis]|uniref:uncharacterized protein LOC125671864 n=1 Tax=Ostrea edulis TaxID=37623 RepID=UPI002095D56B|nr:uncharacterized protein LOC125671864 [Ostrea edulis]
MRGDQAYLEKETALKKVNQIGKVYHISTQYPIFPLPQPFREIFKLRLLHHWGFYQPCMEFSKDFFKCAYEVGRGLEYKECWKEFLDMRECELSIKTRARMVALDHQRQEQGKDFVEKPPRHIFARPSLTFLREKKL